MKHRLPPLAAESWNVRWRRRCVSIPLAIALCVGYLALLPLTSLIALAWDLGGNRRAASRTVAWAAVCALCELFGLAACLVTWPAPTPVQYFIQRVYNVTIYRALIRLFRMRTEVQGLDPLPEGPLLLFSRHAGYVDSLLPCLLLGGRGRRPRFVLARALLWLPCIDIIAQRLPNCIVGRPAGAPSRPKWPDAVRVGRLLDDAGPRDVVVLFPEGGVKRVDTRPDGHLHQLMAPRFGGATALLGHARAARLYLCAHHGLEKVGHLSSMLAGALLDRTVHIRFWAVPRSEIPATSEAQQDWLMHRWQDLDRWVETVATHQ